VDGGTGDPISFRGEPPEIGHGAAGFTDIKTKAGTNLVTARFLKFVRNSAFDARNFLRPAKFLLNPAASPLRP